MPAHFKIIPARNLILFFYRGMVTFEESSAVIADAARHPETRPSMRHLCDLSQVTGVERNYPALLQMQARAVEDMNLTDNQITVVFYAPTPPGQAMAQMARKSWEGLNRAVILVQHTEAEALALLGLPEGSLKALELIGA